MRAQANSFECTGTNKIFTHRAKPAFEIAEMKLVVIYRALSSSDLTALCLDFRERKFVVGDHGRFDVWRNGGTLSLNESLATRQPGEFTYLTT